MSESVNQADVMPLQPDTSASIGLRLVSARKAQGQTVADIARKLKIAESVVLALESDDWTQVGVSDLFMCGYLRNYVQLLGISVNVELVSELRASSVSARLASVNRLESCVTYKSARQSKRRWSWIWLILAVVIVLAALWNQPNLWDGNALAWFNDELKR